MKKYIIVFSFLIVTIFFINIVLASGMFSAKSQNIPTPTPTSNPIPTPTPTPTPTKDSTIPIISTPSILPNGKIGTNYNVSLEATGGNISYNWSVVSGVLPHGLTLSAAVCIAAPCKAPASIYGIPTTLGTYVFSISATGTKIGAKQFTLIVNAMTTY